MNTTELPLVDLHVHVEEDTTLEEIVELAGARGAKIGVVEHAGFGQTISNDDEMSRFIKSLAPVGVDSIKVKRSVRAWRRRGVESMVAANLTFSPMEGISMLLRSFNDFILDLFRCPEDLKAACRELFKPP